MPYLTLQVRLKQEQTTIDFIEQKQFQMEKVIQIISITIMDRINLYLLNGKF